MNLLWNLHVNKILLCNTSCNTSVLCSELFSWLVVDSSSVNHQIIEEIFWTFHVFVTFSQLSISFASRNCSGVFFFFSFYSKVYLHSSSHYWIFYLMKTVLNIVKRTKFPFRCFTLWLVYGTMRSMYSGRSFRTLILSLSIFLHTHTHTQNRLAQKNCLFFKLVLTRILYSLFFFFFGFLFAETAKCQGVESAQHASNDRAISRLLKNISP